MEKLKFSSIMALFGTVGIISVFIPLSAPALSFYRGAIASIFLIALTSTLKTKIDFDNIKKNFFILLLVGILLSINWVLQFESFRVASVSIGTVCYNTMPIFVIILAPIMFKEKLSIKSIICVLMAMLGIIFVSNALNNGLQAKETIGCIYALLAAICYALVVMLNKKLENIPSINKVIIQFIVAAIFLIPYIIFIEKGSFLFYKDITKNQFIIGLICLLVLSFIHTGLAYFFYYETITKIDAVTIAIFTYIDPLVALFLSHFILKESLNTMQIIGAVLILSSTIINEFVHTKKPTIN